MASHLLDIYSVWIHAVSTPRQWASLQRRTGLPIGKCPKSLGQAKHVKEKFPGGAVHHFVVWIDKEAHDEVSDAMWVETCAHESTHIGNMILDLVGHQTYAGNDEPSAYLFGWLTQWVYKAVRST